MGNAGLEHREARKEFPCLTTTKLRINKWSDLRADGISMLVKLIRVSTKSQIWDNIREQSEH